MKPLQHKTSNRGLAPRPVWEPVWSVRSRDQVNQCTLPVVLPRTSAYRACLADVDCCLLGGGADGAIISICDRRKCIFSSRQETHTRRRAGRAPQPEAPGPARRGEPGAPGLPSCAGLAPSTVSLQDLSHPTALPTPHRNGPPSGCFGPLMRPVRQCTSWLTAWRARARNIARQ